MKYFSTLFLTIAFLFQQTVIYSGEGHFGHNGLHYELVKGWGEENLKKVHIKNCQGMVTDSKGRLILLTDDPRNNVIIFNPEGEIIKHWTLNLKGAHGISLHKEKDGTEVLFIADNSGRADSVFKTTMDGKVLMKLGYPVESGKYKSAKQYKPAAVLTVDNGDFYVLDGYGKSYIIHYSKEGKFHNIFGGDIGEGEAQLKKWGPHGGAVDTRDPSQPTLLIACSDRQSLKRFNLNGIYIDKIPLPGANPRDIFINGEYLYIPHLGSDWPNQKDAPGYVSILDKNNRVISNIGGSQPKYENDRLHHMTHHGHTFIHPHGCTMDHEGNLYIAQWMSNKTWPLKFSPAKH